MGDSRIQSCVYRNDTLWVAQTVFLPAGPAPTRSAVQVVEIASDTPGVYRLVRQNRIDDATANGFFALPCSALFSSSGTQSVRAATASALG